MELGKITLQKMRNGSYKKIEEEKPEKTEKPELKLFLHKAK